jgi:molybdopterin synthase catalytic subunit
MPVRVQYEDFDLSSEIARLRAGRPDIGAVVAFVGTVREMNDEGMVSMLELEHYPGMTEAALEQIVAEATRRWSLTGALVVHRIGALQGCEQIVLAAAASRHRAEAFAACEFIMDYLKTRAPFWKKEQAETGPRWVDARASDEAALGKWTA